MALKRNTSVELLRVIACFVVVSLHAAEDIINVSSNNYLDYFVFILLQNGVPIFWFITGFFIFNRDYKGLLYKTFIRIWLPSFIVSVICVITYDLYLSFTSGIELNGFFNYLVEFIYNAMRFRTFAPSCKHFWYIYTYCLLILIYPILKAFVSYIDSDKSKQIIFVIGSLLLIVINEITLNQLADVSNHGFSAVLMASIEVILGHLLYENKQLLEARINGKLAACLFTMLNLIRCIIYILLIKNKIVTSLIAPWFSIFSILNATLLFIICDKVLNQFINEKHNCVITKTAKLTFGIYIFHKIPIKILGKIGVVNYISNANIYIKYLLIFMYFVICFLISTLISFVYNKLIDLVSKKETKNNNGGQI